MSAAISNALSGLAAAAQRLAGVARNVANAGDTSRLAAQPGDPPAFQPTTTVQSALASGGTVASARPVTPAALPSFQPRSPLAGEDGLVATPNVDLTGQAIDLIAAREAYLANLKTLKVAEGLEDSLLKILA
jgi:flagellar basal-body rod protein FlgC